jgi:hypothetical protein
MIAAFSLGTKRRRLTARDGSESVSDMDRSIQSALPPMEVEKLPSPSDRADRGVRKVHAIPERSLEDGKKAVGRVARAGIGDSPRKVYGPDNITSGVVSGERIPDWMARLYNDDEARLRFGKAWLDGAAGVRSRNVTVIEWDEEEAV